MFENLSPDARNMLMYALAQGQKNDPTRSPTGPYGHGDQGLFSLAGQDRQVFSAMLLPIAGMLGRIPVYNGADDVPAGEFGGVNTQFFTTVTGVTQGDGEDFANQPTTECADGALSGLMKACTQISTFGRYRHSPNPIELFRAGQLRDIVDPTYMQLMNQPTGPLGQPFGPTVPTGNVLVQEAARRFFELRATMTRFMARRIWIGSPANNNGSARDITGFDLLINSTAHVDAITGEACPAMDSVVPDFGYQNISADGGAAIVRLIDSVVHQITWISRQTGLDPSTWDISMRADLFDELVKYWPIHYYQEALTAISAYNNGRVVIDATQAQAMRDDMRTNSFLPIRGQRWNVVQDDGITEKNVTNAAQLSAGQFSSDIYFIPKTVVGGVPVTYFKYFNQANGQAEAIVRALRITSTFTSDNAIFRWYVNHKNGCVDMTVDYSPRLIMRTPQIAARITNVAYEPPQHVRSAFPDSPYFADGGRTNLGVFPTFYTPWSPETPVAL